MFSPDKLNSSTRNLGDLIQISYVMLQFGIVELNFEELELNYLINIEFVAYYRLCLLGFLSLSFLNTDLSFLTRFANL